LELCTTPQFETYRQDKFNRLLIFVVRRTGGFATLFHDNIFPCQYESCVDFSDVDATLFHPRAFPGLVQGNLSTVVLQLLTMGVPDVLEFDYMDPPSRDSLVAALELLHDLDAIDKTMRLTDCGRLLAQFPLEPKLAQVVLASSK